MQRQRYVVLVVNMQTLEDQNGNPRRDEELSATTFGIHTVSASSSNLRQKVGDPTPVEKYSIARRVPRKREVICSLPRVSQKRVAKIDLETMLAMATDTSGGRQPQGGSQQIGDAIDTYESQL